METREELIYAFRRALQPLLDIYNLQLNLDNLEKQINDVKSKARRKRIICIIVLVVAFFPSYTVFAGIIGVITQGNMYDADLGVSFLVTVAAAVLVLPKVKCTSSDFGVFTLTVKAVSCPVEDIQNISSSISSALNKRFNQYAVTQTSSDIAFNDVSFQIEDVTIDRSLTFDDISEMKSEDKTKLIVQQNTFIDLTTSGSILVAGKTRSGKTTGIISLLLQALLHSRDKHGSSIVIVDPKQAELSRLPYIVCAFSVYAI